VLSLIVLLIAGIGILRMVDEDTGRCAAAEADADAAATGVVEPG